MMTKDEFYGYVRDHVKEYLVEDKYPEGTSVLLEEVEKIGGLKLTGVSIRKPNDAVAPIVYLDDYYKAYQDGEPISLVLHRIAKADGQAREQINVPRLTVEDLDINAVRDRIFIRACDKERSKSYLEEHPHIDQGDLAATYHIMVGENSAGTMSIAVNNNIAALWGKRPEELQEIALENMRTSTPPEMHDVMSLIQDTVFGSKMQNLLEDDADIPVARESAPAMYVLRYSSEGDGAACIFDPDIMDQAAQKLGSNCFVLPSSRHEVMLMKDTGAVSIDMLSRMVREINQSTVDPRDFLSDHVQYYDRAQKKVLGEREYKAMTDAVEREEKQELKREQKPKTPKL